MAAPIILNRGSPSGAQLPEEPPPPTPIIYSLLTLITLKLLSAAIDLDGSVDLIDPVIVPAGFDRCQVTWNLGVDNQIGQDNIPTAFLLGLLIDLGGLLNLGAQIYSIGTPNGVVATASGSLQLTGLSVGESLTVFASDISAVPYIANSGRLINFPAVGDAQSKFEFLFWTESLP